MFLFAVGIGPLFGGVLAERSGLAAPFVVYAAAGVGQTVGRFPRLPLTPLRPRSNTENAGSRVQQRSLCDRVSPRTFARRSTKASCPPGMPVKIAVLFGDGRACSACDDPLL